MPTITKMAPKDYRNRGLRIWVVEFIINKYTPGTEIPFRPMKYDLLFLL